MDAERLRWLLPVGAFLGPFGGDAIFPLIPTFQAELGITVAQANGLITAYMVPFALLLLVSGAVAETLGERRVLAFGFLLYGGGALGVAASPGFSSMLGARVVQGSGSAFIAPVLLGAIGHQFGPELRGRVMGLFSVFISVGNVLGPFTGGWTQELYGWRVFFVLLAAVSAVVGAMYVAIIRNRGESYALRETAQRLGSVLRNRSVVLMSLSSAAVFFGLIGAASYSSDFLAGPPLSMGEGRVGTIVSLGLGMGIPAGAMAGYLTDRLGRRATALLGFGVMAIGGLALLLVAVRVQVYSFVGGLMLLGFGAHTVFTAYNTLSVELVPESRGTAASVYNSFRFLGYGFAPVALAGLYGDGNIAAVFVAVLAGVGVGALLLRGVAEGERG